VRYAFIAAEKAHYPVDLLCDTLNVSRSGFYAWCGRPEGGHKRRDRELQSAIVRIHAESRKTYGSPRIHAELQARNVPISLKRVARLMRDAGIVARRRRPFRPQTTDSKHSHPIAENLLARDFVRIASDQAWVGDITYVPTVEGWLYLAVLLDLHSRRVVGCSMSPQIDRHLVPGALTMAVAHRGVPSCGVLHHSDRRSQYASKDYRDALAQYSFQCSMSRKGNCWDNAVSESFFSTIKTELVHQRRFATRLEARQSIVEYIEVFYNRQRRHATLGYLSPVQFEADNARMIRQVA
jgi:transposase InsO family protein